MAKKNLFADLSEEQTEFVYPGQQGEGEDEEQRHEDSDADEIPERDAVVEDDELEADDTEVDTDVDEPEADDEEEDDDEFSFQPFLEGLSKSGALIVDEDKEYDDSDEGFAEAIKDTVSARLQETVASLPQTAQRLIKLAMEGGTEDDLQDLLTLEDGVDWEEADLDEEDVQKAACEEAMRLRDPELSDEDIEEALADLEDLGKLRKQAERDVKFLSKQAEIQKQEVESRIAQREQEATQLYEAEVKKVRDYVFSLEDVAGLPLTKKEKEGFLDYLTVKDKKGLTESDKRNTFERRIMKEYLNYQDFNVKQVERKVTTDVTKNIKKQLARYKAKPGQGGNQPLRVEREGDGLGKIVMPWDE